MNNESRRSFLRNSVLATGGLGLMGTNASSMTSSSVEIKKGASSPITKKLSFNKDGKFKIVQFTDIHAVYKEGERVLMLFWSR
jgi:hypothetical protein